ncbi:FAD-dependent 5-carboxymethylaminomethyl-2-thiouridine(34) oxidoreductase MnmC [Collimonas sp.]|jgi:tRNA 5-methylaminomethyl-2-thiouridine biosynthesis bifunctional protein|uniref:FAD-dependent 5-carboxymethylaminomethyl-2-thiouridine(34) oxidoreductase MnmC n=1 Tax=Collimonas sp. TaxID=1963772 RepID=UPI002D12EDD9|nr:FAD-dependent 5-carboxymethylaminomethyl-2-thiouridine(34) oxidoreductase MnmC [Collimonas sp.]HWW06479.1 FAD-dependent 5-carboxymethylaminomethyl-2-thiouridine(34) oxidoreductase MnmC [Collimonas sp.]
MTTPDPATSLSYHAPHWQGRENFVLLDSEFGSGEHFFATWQTWLEDPQRSRQLHYLAPLPQLTTLHDLQLVCARFPEWQILCAELCSAWPPAVPGFHRIFLQHEQLILTLMIGDSATCLRQIVAKVDAFRIHGHGWKAWPMQVLSTLGRLAAEHASLDISVAEEVARKQLQQAGFVFENAADGEPQTSALRGRFTPRFKPRPAATTAHSERRAIVIGAGLAGSAACQRLVQRGWSVDLIESQTTPAQQASGNPAGIFMPVLSRDDNPGSRLSRSAYLFALQVWRQLGGIGNTFDGAACGVLQIARDAEHAEGQQQLARHWRYPADYAQWLDQAVASERAGSPVSGGGWYFPAAGWVRPSSLCQAMLDSCGTHLQIHFGRRAASIERQQGKDKNCWTIRDQHGAEIASAPVVILANACDALRFSQAEDLPLSAIRGQVTYLEAKQVPAITPVLCGEAYLTPAYEGVCSVGASYDEDQQSALRQESQDANLARLANILPGWRAGQLPLAGRVGFRCVAIDRLPLVGALPDKDGACAVREAKLKDLPRFPGLYSLLGYASRGLIWAPLAAELLASQLNGEPLPIEADLAAALDPARFLLKQQRRGATPQR